MLHTRPEISLAEPRDLPGLTATTLVAAFQRSCHLRGIAPAIRGLHDDEFCPWNEYRRRVEDLASGLEALGVGPGDRVALLLPNRPEALVVDLAALHIRAIPFSVHTRISATDLSAILASASPNLLVTELRYLELVRSAAAPTLNHVLLVDAEPVNGRRPKVSGLSAVAQMAPAHAARQGPSEDDIATLLYTSGTTGSPKAIPLTHRHILASLRSLSTVFPMRAGGRAMSWLPLAHIADRGLGYYWHVFAGSSVTTVPDSDNLVKALVRVRPTHWSAVPRALEQLMAHLVSGGTTNPSALNADDRAGVRSEIGLDDIDGVITGSAPNSPDVLRFFDALGVPVREAWGMSEIAGLGTINPIARPKIGTVGLPLPGVRLRVAEDGELLVAGPTVMEGYYDQAHLTAGVIDREKWLHSGDLAAIDADGYVRICGRKKELIVTSWGRKVAPVRIEQALKAETMLIGEVCAIGDGRPFVTALVTLDLARADVLAGSEEGLHNIVEVPAVSAEIEAAVRRANAKLSQPERIRRHTLLPIEWQPGSEELTPTSKLRRSAIAEKYRVAIDEMYGSAYLRQPLAAPPTS